MYVYIYIYKIIVQLTRDRKLLRNFDVENLSTFELLSIPYRL